MKPWNKQITKIKDNLAGSIQKSCDANSLFTRNPIINDLKGICERF